MCSPSGRHWRRRRWAGCTARPGRWLQKVRLACRCHARPPSVFSSEPQSASACPACPACPVREGGRRREGGRKGEGRKGWREREREGKEEERGRAWLGCLAPAPGINPTEGCKRGPACLGAWTGRSGEDRAPGPLSGAPGDPKRQDELSLPALDLSSSNQQITSQTRVAGDASSHNSRTPSWFSGFGYKHREFSTNLNDSPELLRLLLAFRSSF